MTKYVAPAMSSSAFTCPGCGAYAQVLTSNVQTPHGQIVGVRSTCHLCRYVMLWSTEGALLWPPTRVGPPAHEDMPAGVREQYFEAAEIGARSPRAAAALLRLALQTLLLELVPGETNLNTAIGNLVEQGLPPMVQRSMDLLRFTGNNAVHPAEIQLHEDPQTLQTLFALLNTVVEDRITRPRAVEELYEQLPAGIKDQIQKRDSPPGGGNS